MQCDYELKLLTLDFEVAQYSHMLLVVSSEKEMAVIRLALIAFYSFSSSQALCRKCGIKRKGTITALISNDMELFCVQYGSYRPCFFLMFPCDAYIRVRGEGLGAKGKRRKRVHNKNSRRRSDRLSPPYGLRMKIKRQIGSVSSIVAMLIQRPSTYYVNETSNFIAKSKAVLCQLHVARCGLSKSLTVT